MSQFAVFNAVAFSSASGLALAPNATIEVRRESDGALAAIFSDEAGTALANPFSADSVGRFGFYAAGLNEGYSVKVTYGVETYTLHNVALGLAQQRDTSGLGPTLLQLADEVAARTLLAGSVASRAANTILGASDIDNAFVATASFTQTFDAAATLGDGWVVAYRVESGFTITFDPNGTEQIDGGATKAVVGPNSGLIYCNGSALYTFGFVGAASDTAAGLIEIATQAEMEAASDTTRAVTPGRLHFDPGVAKAWGYANSTGSSVLASLNISSLTDNGTGDWTWNFTTAFSSVSYGAAIMGTDASGNTKLHACQQDSANAPTASAFRIVAGNVSDVTSRAQVDMAHRVVFFGDQ